MTAVQKESVIIEMKYGEHVSLAFILRENGLNIRGQVIMGFFQMGSNEFTRGQRVVGWSEKISRPFDGMQGCEQVMFLACRES